MGKILKTYLQKIGQEIPETKPSLKTKAWESLNPKKDEIWQAKLDGAFLYHKLGPDGIRAFSYRRRKGTETPIEHTSKLLAAGTKVPKELYGTLIRAEAYHPDLTSSQVGGILNMRDAGDMPKLHSAIHGITRLEGLDLKHMSGVDKINKMREIANKLEGYEVPDTATTPQQKKKLMQKIQSGKHPQTREGIVAYPEGDKPYRAVITPTMDVPIIGTTKGRGKYEGSGIGALLAGGEYKGNIGTGLSDKLRTVLKNNPELASGLVARVKAREKFPSGSLRAPSFHSFHPEKSDPQALAKLQKLMDTKK